MKSLENYGVLEMNANEIKEIEGGYWWLPATAIAIYLFDNRDRFVDGLENGLSLSK